MKDCNRTSQILVIGKLLRFLKSNFSVPLKTYDVQNKSPIKRINGLDELLAFRLMGPTPTCSGSVFERFGSIFHLSSPCFEVISHQL